MVQRSLSAVFMRGGTSKGLLIHAKDLPDDRAEWTTILCSAMGSPDAFGRQLDGMGGGISSLSKVCVIGPSTRPDADIDFTFVQVMIKEERIDFRANCGNMSSAVGPFAYDEGLVSARNSECTVRIHNTNTHKIIRSQFAVDGTHALYDGEYSIPGVGSPGARIRLDFLEPGGATTGRLLPSGHIVDTIDVPDHGPVAVSLIDAANAVVFVSARDVGLRGDESPSELEVRTDVMVLLEALRREASVRMGIAPDIDAAASINSVPFVAIISEPRISTTLSGELIAADDAHLVARVISNGQPHRALPLTVSLCTAVAAHIGGSVVAKLLPGPLNGPLRLAMPSGILEVDAAIDLRNETWVALSGTFFRTARRLFDGRVWYREQL